MTTRHVATTRAELIALENLRHETGLRGELLKIEFVKRKHDADSGPTSSRMCTVQEIIRHFYSKDPMP